MYDGMERILQEVRYVPDLKRKLISLGMLDQIGCTFKAENGCLKVVRGSLVIMKGVKVDGLYILDGRSLIGSVSNVQNHHISKKRMWLIRLGHISERGLVELSKKKGVGVQLDDYSRRVWVYNLKSKDDYSSS